MTLESILQFELFIGKVSKLIGPKLVRLVCGFIERFYTFYIVFEYIESFILCNVLVHIHKEQSIAYASQK